MNESELLSPRQVSEYLSASAQDVSQFVKEGKLVAYRIGGTYLRFRREEVLEFREQYLKERERLEKTKEAHIPESVSSVRVDGASQSTWGERAVEFWYFNDFYVYVAALTGLFVYFIFR